MGGGNAQKSKMAREKNLEKQRNAAKGIVYDPFTSLFFAVPCVFDLGFLYVSSGP